MNIKFLTAQQSWALNEVRGGVEVEDWQDEVSFAATLRSLHRLHPDLITIEESKRGPTWFWARPTPQGLELLDQRERTSEDEAIEARNLSEELRVSCGLAMERYTPAGRWVTWMSLLAYPWAKAHGIPWAQAVAP